MPEARISGMDKISSLFEAPASDTKVPIKPLAYSNRRIGVLIRVIVCQQE